MTLVVASVATGAPGAHLCPPGQLTSHGATLTASKGAVLDQPDRHFHVRFDDTRTVNADVVLLTQGRRDVTLAPGDAVSASMSPYLRSSDGTIFPGLDNSGQLSPRDPPSLRITSFGAVQICVEIDAGALIGVHPGQFESTVGVTGKDLSIPSAIPVVVTFRSSRWLAFALVAGGVLAGLLVKMFADLVAARHAPTMPRSVRAYIRDWKFATAVVLGAITGWIGYEILYDSNPVWGAAGADGVKLFWTCFSFQLAGIGALDLVRRLIGDLPGGP